MVIGWETRKDGDVKEKLETERALVCDLAWLVTIDDVVKLVWSGDINLPMQWRSTEEVTRSGS
uniref:Uncharacterized protein n=1 Tax=Cucumis melo TaxID=3656 RepID=A0A9I9DHS6_CUCME